MTKEKQRFVCGDCGADFGQWVGKCAACGAWNTLKAFNPGSGGNQSRRPASAVVRSEPTPLSNIANGGGARIQVGIGEFNRVLGGGLTPGSVSLIAGDPGIGKSTLLMEALSSLAAKLPVLYVSGEESPQQLKQRADRLGIRGDNFPVLMENRLEEVMRVVEETNPSILVVDSVQTLASDDIPAAAGAVTQVRECAGRLIALAKHKNMAMFLVGHVTKEGQIAGPRVLEHMVDTVLYFEGERGHDYRIIRAVKNRFGPANEIGVFEMRSDGLQEVKNPSELFLSERVQGAAGSVVFAGMEGTRPVLLEIQSLVAPSPLAQPRRTTLGWDSNRLAMLTAVLEKRLGLGLFSHDIFLNIAGGFRITETAADLAVAASLFASHRNLSVDPGLVIIGEVGLAGEVRAVSHAITRIKESAKLGFSRCMLPKKVYNKLPDDLPIKIDPITSIDEMIELLGG
ncbi:MAG: DNA repair protein RadA [Magnetococcales bacterium]|nr:DNA repair protein RadA [Magnetococcales bacterium]